MANVRTILSFLDYTPTASEADALFPVTNLALYTVPFRPYKATQQGSLVNVTLDLGSGNTLSGLAANPGIFLNPVNFTSIKLQANSVTSDWTTPPWTQSVTIAKDRWSGRYKAFLRFADLDAAAVAYRYINVQIQAVASVDALPYRIGEIIVGQIVEWSINPSGQPERVRHDHVRVSEFLDGGREVAKIGEPAMAFSYSRKLYSLMALNEQLDLNDLGLDQPFVLWDAALGNGSQDGFIVRRTEAMPLSQRFLSFNDGQLALREVT